ncbi:MAG: class I SAM-dependent methyltransferase [Anaerolineales bacterium]
MNTKGLISKRPQDYQFDKLYSSRELLLQQTRKFLLRRFRDDEICHWYLRIELLEKLISALSLRHAASVLDLGTQVGTFAIELAQRGFRVTGVDISEEAIRLARSLSKHADREAEIEFVVGDVDDRTLFQKSQFDLVAAQDIFEHLHSDVLASALHNCVSWLRPGGYLVYHTYPTKYDYLFHPSTNLQKVAIAPLLPFFWLPDHSFSSIVDFYHDRVVNSVMKARTGQTWEQSLLHRSHCNLLTMDALSQALSEAGFENLFIRARNLYASDRRGLRSLFRNKQYFQRNLYGVAWKPLDTFV